MKLIVGLGNPGSEYEATRHNVGFMVIDELASQAGISLSSKKFDAAYGQGSVEGVKAALLKPQTYMNLSGDSVAPAARFFKVEPQDLVVVHDELDLPLGRLQVKLGGGTGGHNGLRSIVARLGSGDFVRIRVGIGKPNAGRSRVVGHVLSPFSRDEQETVEEAVKRAAEAVQVVVARGVQKAMNEFNKR